MAVHIDVLPDASLAAEAAARSFAAIAERAIDARGEFIVALAGGSTPRPLYELLAREPFAARIDWTRTQIFWGDERCVPADDASSNYRMVREALLDRVALPKANVHRIRGEDDPSRAASACERELRATLRTPAGPPRDAPGTRFDLVLLGLGRDGHTASLFPGSKRVHSSDRWVMADEVPSVPMWRITLTPVVINAAAEVVFFVSGAAKAAAVRGVLEGARRPHELPAQLIAPPRGHVRWFLDAAAAAELGRTNGA